MEPPWEVGKEVCINGTGHMIKMAAMLIYGKNLQKSSPTELIVGPPRGFGDLGRRAVYFQGAGEHC